MGHRGPTDFPIHRGNPNISSLRSGLEMVHRGRERCHTKKNVLSHCTSIARPRRRRHWGPHQPRYRRQHLKRGGHTCLKYCPRRLPASYNLSCGGFAKTPAKVGFRGRFWTGGGQSKNRTHTARAFGLGILGLAATGPRTGNTIKQVQLKSAAKPFLKQFPDPSN